MIANVCLQNTVFCTCIVHLAANYLILVNDSTFVTFYLQEAMVQLVRKETEVLVDSLVCRDCKVRRAQPVQPAARDRWAAPGHGEYLVHKATLVQ